MWGMRIALAAVGLGLLLLGLLWPSNYVVASRGASQTAVACSKGLELELSTREPAQGEIVVVAVKGEPRTDLRASWSRRKLHFWQHGTDAGAHPTELTLVGVDLRTEPDIYPLTVDARLSSGETVGCSTDLTVRDGGFPVQRLTVARSAYRNHRGSGRGQAVVPG